MSTITLETIEKTQATLAEMIEQFPPLNDGEQYVGAIISADGSRKHHIILLQGSRCGVTWDEAMKWAKAIGGELFDRLEGTFLHQTIGDEFEPGWYWTREQHASSHNGAWGQSFGSGYQGFNHKSRHLCARAIRRVEIL